jgi:hypothetical protein
VRLNANAPADAAGQSKGWTEARLVTWLLGAFLAWMALQTPVAVIAFEYLHVSARVAQAILLTKDVWAAALFAVLLARHYREVRFRWYDWFALAYAILVGVYSIVPAALGSHLPALAVIASARELLVPVELYGLGRLAAYAGVSPLSVARSFLAVAAAAAIFSVGAFVLLPQTFWQTTYDLLGFVYNVQGITTATSLWGASILGGYGNSLFFLRAVGPFTHPVGTGVYFALPLTLALCAVWTGDRHRKAGLAVAVIGLVLFWLAVLTPISRGIWIGLGGAVLVTGLVLQRLRLAALTIVFFVVVVALVPPFSYAISSAANGSDGSTIAHTDAINRDLQVMSANPLGFGVGQGDQYGTIFAAAAGADAAGVGENMYFTTYASVGPLGLFAFAVWLVALLFGLLAQVRPRLPAWLPVGLGAGLLAEAAAAMTASTLMRFTTGASIMLLVGLVMAEPVSSLRWAGVFGRLDPRERLAARQATPQAASPATADAPQLD